MKIYGQSLREIFDKLPWQYKIVVGAGSLFILFVMIIVPIRILTSSYGAPRGIEPLRIAGLRRPPLGTLDPALAFNPKTNTVWMAYTSMESPQSGSGNSLLQTRLATARADKCENWSIAQGGFEAKRDDILAPDGQTVMRSGAWRIETPALVYDPDDRGREWKLYAYKYFWAEDPAHTLQVAQHYGMIVYKYASDPAGEWSTEQWLFSPAPDYPPAPYQQMVLLHLNALDPSLKNVVTYARPSVIYKDGALVMTLSAFTEGMSPDRVIMIVSRDHGASWRYVGAPLRQSNLKALGPYTVLGGATLIEQEGNVYLAAVLGDEKQRGKGTFIFGFEDFAKGILKPAPLRQIPLNAKEAGDLGGGFAAYAEACGAGVLTSEQVGNSTSFQIFKTHQKPVEKK